jgi:hypothetical protein
LLHQVGNLFELNVKLWCQKVKVLLRYKAGPSVLVRKPQGNNHMENQDIDGKIILK